MRSAMTQVRQLFPALAGQQGVDPRFVKFMTDLASAAKIEAKDDGVELTATLTAAELAAALKR